jgi:hypothetical protein
VRCGKCGNENAEGNRFCGMCGAPLLSPPRTPEPVSAARTAAPQPSVTRAVNQPAPTEHFPRPREVARPRDISQQEYARPEETYRREPAPEQDAPTITGPSFLGLNQPASRTGRQHGYRDHDPHHSSSGSVDYLLEDEEEPPRRWGKIILLLLALALAGGFGYLHWKQGGFDWLTSGDKKPQVDQNQAQQNPDGTQSSADSGGTTANPAPTGTSPSATSPAGTTSEAPPPQNAAPGTVPANSAAPDANTQTAPAQTQPSTSENAPPPTFAAPAKSNAPSAGNNDANEDDSADQTADSEPAKQTAPPPQQVVHSPRVSKPSALKPAPAKPVDPVTEAERSIYGRGEPQDCDRGLRLLKPVAAQANPAAMISLGTLYSTGTCTPRDLPTAYRWFALALHKQPDNLSLQNNLQKLWSQMTQPERQLAIKLSQ